MKTKEKPQILTPKDTYTMDYPQAIKAAEEQMKIIWFATELGVEKDTHDIRTKMQPGERHGLVTTLKLFTKYETMLGGDEFWGGKVCKMFPRPDVERMANAFSFAEINMHAPFYNLVNEALKINTDDFYNEWKNDPVLVDRVNFIKEASNSKDPLTFTAAFTFMEGSVLFSNFAYIKSLNSGGYNMASHISAGVDASAKDENFHAMGSAWLHNQTIKEYISLGQWSVRKANSLKKKIREIAQKVFDHEMQIIEMIFSGGEIRTITKEEMIEFVKNRIDVVLAYLNQPALFGIPEGKVSKWFYNELSSYKYADFFSNQQIQYRRDWSKIKLKFKSVEM